MFTIAGLKTCRGSDFPHLPSPSFFGIIPPLFIMAKAIGKSIRASQAVVLPLADRVIDLIESADIIVGRGSSGRERN